MNLRAAIYDPYLDTLGGGERYCLTIAEILLKRGWRVDLFWSGDPLIIPQAQNRFNLQIANLNLVPDIFGITPQHLEMVEESSHLPKHHQSSPVSFINKIKITNQYDLFFFLSDGSLPLLFAKQNLLHLQVPFRLDLSTSTKFINQIKLLNSRVICNSQFTQQFVNSTYSVKSRLLYPPVDISQFSHSKKEKIILSVGRFDNILNAKRQDVLISAFIKFSKKYDISGWKLILAGGSLTQPESNNYLNLLKKQAKGYPVEFLIQPDFQQLAKTYAVSQIYWHAAGFGVDEIQHPENTEHFGITVVEAMASGLVPLVINKGGLPEIIQPDHNGYLWQTEDDLINQTFSLINNPVKISTLSQQAILDSQKYSKQNFENNLMSILDQKQ